MYIHSSDSPPLETPAQTMLEKEELKENRRGKKSAIVLVVIIIIAAWIGIATYRYANQIVIINIQGEIYEFQNIASQLYAAQIDPNVKIVILYIDSPGGSAYSCLELGNYVNSLALIKPVIAVTGTMCASGAYYIASFATEIITSENALTGGIGAIALWIDLSKYYEKEGIEIWVWTTGEQKDFGAPWKSPSPEDQQKIQENIDYIFERILTDIQRNRNLSAEDLEEVKSGDIYLGMEAIDFGLADKIGNIYTAIDDAVEKANLTSYIIVPSSVDNKIKFLHALGLMNL